MKGQIPNVITDFATEFIDMVGHVMVKETPQGEYTDISSDIRLDSARRVVEECLWGDYLLSAEEVLARLESGEPGFDRFIFSKILENSRKPSWHLPVLFQPEVLESLLARYLRMAGDKKRVRLVAANLTGRYDLVPELQWQK